MNFENFLAFTINLNANGQVYTFKCNDYDQIFDKLCYCMCKE